MSRDLFPNRVRDLVKGIALYPGKLSPEIIIAVINRLSRQMEQSISAGFSISIWTAALEIHHGCDSIVNRETLIDTLVSELPAFAQIGHIGRIAYLESLESLRMKLLETDQTVLPVGQTTFHQSVLFITRASVNSQDA
jgi:hypothetical protein